MSDLDHRVRLAAFAFLEQQYQLHGETALARDVLARGFVFEGTRVPLLAPQGIFKPAILDLPLSITTVPPVEGKPRPYDDDLDPNGLLPNDSEPNVVRCDSWFPQTNDFVTVVYRSQKV